MEGSDVESVALAPLFFQRIECYPLINSAWTLERDYGFLEIQFKNLELRLASWGKACGLTGTDNGLANEASTRQAIANTLHRIQFCLHNVQGLKHKYGAKPTEDAGLEDTAIETQPEPATAAGPRFRFPLLRRFERSEMSQRKLHLRANWIVTDKKKFEDLVNQLRVLIEDLESHTKHLDIPERQRHIIENEMQEIRDARILRGIRDAHGSDNDIVSSAAGMRLKALCDSMGYKDDDDSVSCSTVSQASYHTASEDPQTTDEPFFCLSVENVFPELRHDDDGGTATKYISELLIGAAPFIECLKTASEGLKAGIEVASKVAVNIPKIVVSSNCQCEAESSSSESSSSLPCWWNSD